MLGIDGLRDQSKKPHNSPNRKIDADIETLILNMRKKRKLGARRIQNELNSITIGIAHTGHLTAKLQ